MSSEVYFRRSFEWNAGENNLIKTYESNDKGWNIVISFHSCNIFVLTQPKILLIK